MKTRLTAPARRQTDRIDRWWRQHRPDAQDLFARELGAARTLLADMPDLGTPYLVRRRTMIRRVLLPKTKHHVYYTVERTEGVVMILAIWGAPQGRGPQL